MYQGGGQPLANLRKLINFITTIEIEFITEAGGSYDRDNQSFIGRSNFRDNRNKDKYDRSDRRNFEDRQVK